LGDISSGQNKETIMSEVTMKQGEYLLDETSYHALGLPYASSHRLKTMANAGIEQVWHDIENPPSPSPAMALGSAFHCLVLDRDSFNREYIVAPKVDRRTKAGKQEWEDFQTTAGRRTVLTEDQYATAKWMAGSVINHQWWEDTIPQELDRNMTERSFIFKKSTSACCPSACKARIDYLHDGLLLDLKTTSGDLSINSLTRTMANYGYAEQLAFYLMAATSCGVPVNRVVVGFVRNVAPHSVRFVEIDPEWLTAATGVVEGRLAQWVEHLTHLQRHGSLQDSFVGCDDLEMPAWYGNVLG
jgi:exodeoxyribonuclease VIII